MGREVPENLPENPKIDLKDIQKKVLSYFPKNAILCGFNLHFDLHALQVDI